MDFTKLPPLSPGAPDTPAGRLYALHMKRKIGFDTVHRNPTLQNAGVTVERYRALMEAQAAFTMGDGIALAKFFAMGLSDFQGLLTGVAVAPLFVDVRGFSDCATVGDAVARARKEKKMTQNQLAKLTGYPQTRISQIERGTARPLLDTMQTLANALGVPWNSLVPSYQAAYYIAAAKRAELYEADPELADEDPALLDELADVL